MHKLPLIISSLLMTGSVTAFAAQPAPVVDVSQNSNAPAVPAPASTQQAATTSAASSAVNAMALNVPSTQLSAASDNAMQAIPMSQRVARLEQQMANITRMNMPQQIADIQQTLQQLQGQLQVQAHDLKMLNEQQRSFYQDLNQQINQLKNLSSGTPSTNTNTSTSTNPPPASSSKAIGLALKDSDTYKAAFDLMMKKQFPKAISAFQSYLNTYPNGQFKANAYYWLGQIYFQQKKYSASLKQFQILIAQSPKSAKVPDAQLKMAIIHAKTGKVAQAKKELLVLKQKHPGSTAAQLATIQLQQLNAAPTNVPAGNVAQ